MDQYANVFQLANQLKLRNPDVVERGGKLHIKGLTTYQLEANQLWDAIKTHPNWANEIVADIQAERKDLFGVHTVAAGDTLSKLAKRYLGDAGAYMKIFEANRDMLKDPNMIKVGQELKIPVK
ncbi:MAG: LysM peptidoglycan-binding domain-containing protein [Vicinamibacterales bacterium]